MAESFTSVSLEEKKMREMTKSTNFLWEGKHRKDYFVYIKIKKKIVIFNTMTVESLQILFYKTYKLMRQIF